MSFNAGIDANTAMRVPSTMRAAPLCAASQLARRCGLVMPLCSDTTASSPKRALKRASSCGVRLISGTITSACAGSRASRSATQRRYTSVLPLPVLPASRKVPVPSSMRASTAVCSALSATGFDDSAVCATGPAALLRLSRRASCAVDRSRSCGGRAASAISPMERW